MIPIAPHHYPLANGARALEVCCALQGTLSPTNRKGAFANGSQVLAVPHEAARREAI